MINGIPDSVMNAFVSEMMPEISKFYEIKENRERYEAWRQLQIH